MLRDLFTYAFGTFIGTVAADVALYAVMRRLRPKAAERLAQGFREAARALVPPSTGFVGEPTAQEAKILVDDNAKGWAGFTQDIQRRAAEEAQERV